MLVLMFETPSTFAKSLRTAAAQPPQVISGNLSVTSITPSGNVSLLDAVASGSLGAGLLVTGGGLFWPQPMASAKNKELEHNRFMNQISSREQTVDSSRQTNRERADSMID